MKCLTDVCSDFHNYETDRNSTNLVYPKVPVEEHRHILREEAEAAVTKLEMGVNSIPVEYVKAGGEAIIDVLALMCNKIWRQENGRRHGLKERRFATGPELQNYQPYQPS